MPKSNTLPDEVREAFLKDPELFDILDQRVKCKFNNVMNSELISIIPEDRRKFWVDQREDVIIAGLLDEEMTALAKELERYRKKYGAELLDDFAKAKGGTKRIICRLLEWDKSFINVVSFREALVAAQESNDKAFIKAFSDAVAKVPGYRPIPRKDGVVIEKLKTFSRFFGPEDIQKNIKFIHNFLNDEGLLGDNKADLDYFRKLLKLHEIIPS